jgi:hypothetical protein
MRLRYENTMEDLLAFQAYHIAHSPTMKRMQVGNRWGGALVIFGLTLWIAKLDTGNMFAGLIGAGVGAGVYALIYPLLVRRSIRRRTLKLYAEGQNKGFLGEHELEVADDGLIGRSPYSESKIAWGTVERIETTPEYTFLYVGSVSAYIIPHNRIIEGDYRAFLTELGQRFHPDQRLQRAYTA